VVVFTVIRVALDDTAPSKICLLLSWSSLTCSFLSQVQLPLVLSQTLVLGVLQDVVTLQGLLHFWFENEVILCLLLLELLYDLFNVALSILKLVFIDLTVGQGYLSNPVMNCLYLDVEDFSVVVEGSCIVVSVSLLE